MQLSALSEEFQSAFKGGDAQCSLSRKDSGASGLQVKHRSARSAAGVSRLADFFEEFTGAPVVTFVEGEVRLLQNRRHVLAKCFSYLATEYAAHICSLFAGTGRAVAYFSSAPSVRKNLTYFFC
jgi:hypothetical protein